MYEIIENDEVLQATIAIGFTIFCVWYIAIKDLFDDKES